MTAENRWLAYGLALSLLVHATLLLQKFPSSETLEGSGYRPLVLNISLAAITGAKTAGSSGSPSTVPAVNDPNERTIVPGPPSPKPVVRKTPADQTAQRTNVRPASASRASSPEPVAPKRRRSAAESPSPASADDSAALPADPLGAAPEPRLIPRAGGAPETPGDAGLGAVAARAGYEQVLAAWIERQKYYPLLARRRGLEGTISLRIALRRDGSVASSRLVLTSEHDELDDAALDIIRRATPFPPVPESIGGTTFEFTVPIRFKLE